MSEPAKPAKITADRLAEIVGVTTARLRQLTAAGEIPSPQNGEYETSPTLTALFAYYRRRAMATTTDLKAQRTREASRRADLLDLEYAEKQSRLVEMDKVQSLVSGAYLPVRQTIQVLPSEMGPRCNPTDPILATEALQQWVDNRFFPSIRAGIEPMLASAGAELAPKPQPQDSDHEPAKPKRGKPKRKVLVRRLRPRPPPDPARLKARIQQSPKRKTHHARPRHRRKT